MSRHLTSQRYVFKIHSSRLRRAKWHLTLTISQARENKELIALNESQMMRFIDELNEVSDMSVHIADMKAQIKKLQMIKDLAFSRPKIRKLYAELDDHLFQKDYVCVVIDTTKDYMKLYKISLSSGRFKNKWSAMVSSTAPRLEPRCPPVTLMD